MNERIRPLYYECQDESLSTEDRYQKFAELIVQECIRICMRDYTGIMSAPPAPWIVEQLKQHFGVEE